MQIRNIKHKESGVSRRLSTFQLVKQPFLETNLSCHCQEHDGKFASVLGRMAKFSRERGCRLAAMMQ
jgi:hypothetical protein